MKALLVALGVACTQPALAQVRMTQYIRLGDQASLTQDEAFNRFITRDSFCTLVLEQLLFSESIPGKFLLDLSLVPNPSSRVAKPLRVVLDELIEVKESGTPVVLKISNKALASQINLSGTSDIDISVRLIPVVDARYDQVYATLLPLLGTPAYLPEVSQVFDRFVAFTSSGDARASLLFHANVPVAQNIIEAQRVRTTGAGKRTPLENGVPYAITIQGSRQITDSSIVGKAKDFLNGVGLVVAGRAIVDRPESTFKGMMRLRFHKDDNPVLPEAVARDLAKLSSLAEEASTQDNMTQLKSKAKDLVNAVEAVATAGQIDARSEFYLKNHVTLALAYGQYVFASQGGSQELRNADNWRLEFSRWHQTMNFDGQSQSAQAYGVSGIYPQDGFAKIFLPYSLTDRMTLQAVRWQVMLNQALQRLDDRSLMASRGP